MARASFLRRTFKKMFRGNTWMAAAARYKERFPTIFRQDKWRPLAQDSLWRTFFGMKASPLNLVGASRRGRNSLSRLLRIEGLEQKQLLAIDVAVVDNGFGVNNEGFAAIVAQLNDNTHGFDFNAVQVTPSQVDSAGELAAYDVVVIGNEGSNVNTGDQFEVFASALRTWVEGGGGVVATGWTVFGAQDAAETDIDAILGVNVAPGHSHHVAPYTLDVNATAHPVTDGVADFTDSKVMPSDGAETATAGLDTGISLAEINGSPAVVVDEPGSGRSVYLGPIYAGQAGFYDTTELRSGEPDQLLEQAVNWAAGFPTGPFATTYVNDDWSGFSFGDPIPDADDETAGAQPATFGVDAFATIQEGIDNVTAGGRVAVNDGIYEEQLVINKALNLDGEDKTITIIDGLNTPVSTLGNVSARGQVGEVQIHDFTFANAGPSSATPFLSHIALNVGSSAGGSYFIHNNVFDGVGDDHGFYSNEHSGSVVLTGNVFSDYANNSILLERATGGHKVDNNQILQGGTPNSGIFDMTYAGDNVTGSHLFRGNVITMTGADANGITINPSPFFVPGATGKYSFVEISGNTIGTAGGHGITLRNDSASPGTAGEITSAVISANTVTGTTGTGIRLIGRSTSSISNNSVSGFATGISTALGAGVSAPSTTVFNNSIAGNTTHISNSGAVLNASANWWGSEDGNVVVLGMVGPVDFTPLLDSGTDTSAAVGFQGDFSVLNVTDKGAQIGGPNNRIAEGFSLLAPGGTLNVQGMHDEPFVAPAGTTVSPGSSPGIMTVSGFTVGPTNTVMMEVNGFVAGVEHDQIIVDGSPPGPGGDGPVVLGGATLALSGTGLPASGIPIVLIDNDAVDAVSGTFAGLAEAATFAFAGGTYQISYVGGTGNDVTLTRLFAPPVGGVYEFEMSLTSASEAGPTGGQTVPRLTVLGDFSLITNPADRTVQLSSILGTATLGVDYTLANFIIPQANFLVPTTFDLTATNAPNPGPSVTIINDSTVEGNEFFNLDAKDLSAFIDPADIDGNFIVETTDTHTIVDDDKSKASIVATDPTAAEVPVADPQNPGLFTVSLSQQSATPTTVNYTVSGSATPGADYIALSGSVIIPANTSSATIPVDVVDDFAVEGTENVIVTLTSTSNPAFVSIDTAADDATVNILDNDAATVSVAVSDGTASETGPDDGEFTITLSQTSATDTTVLYTLTGTATNGFDYDPTPLTALIPAGSTTATVPINVIDDADFEGPETVILTLVSTSNPGITVDPLADDATITIVDNDVATVTIAATDQAAEPADNGAFTLTMSQASPTDTTVTYTVGGTAMGGSDYKALTGSATIPAGSTTATIPVEVINDALLEPTETVIVTLNSATNNPAITASGSATVNIVDDDTAAGATVSITATDPSAAEPADNGEFTFTLSAPSGTDTTVNFTMTGSATEGQDYAPIGSSVVIPAGSTSKTVAVNVINDSKVESLETVVLTIDNTSNPAITPDPGKISATVTIADNDVATVSIVATDPDASEPGPTPNNGLFTVTLSAQSASSTTVFYNIGGTATNGTDYSTLSGSVTIPANTSSATIPVNVLEDLLIEGTETVILTVTGTSNPSITVGAPASATVNIADNDAATVTVAASDPNAAEPADPGQFTISLSQQSATPTTVNYTITGTATNGVDYGPIANSVIIPANTSSVNIPINVIDDFVVEGNETVIITLTTATGTPGLVVDLNPATVTIADNEASTVSIVATDPNAAEPADDGTFTVTLSQQSATPTIITYTVSGSATGGSDYATLSGTLTIPANTSTGTILVDVIDDLLVEGTEAVTVTLTGTSNGSILIGAPASATVNIADNDVGTVSIIATDGVAAEPSDDGTFTVTLTQQSPTPTTVFYTVGGTAMNGVDYQPLSGAVTIPANTSSMGILVDVIDDGLLEGSETVIVTLTNTNNPGITIGSPNSATVTIADNEINQPPVVTTNTGSTVAEGGTDVITSTELFTTDPDTAPSSLVYTVTAAPTNALGDTLRLSGAPTTTFTQADINAGLVTYVHDGSETTSDSFSFSVTDGVSSVSGTFTITVTPVNDPPVVVNPIADQTVQEDSAPTVINISGVFSDPEGQALTFTVASSNPALVNATISGNNLTLTYGPNQFGTATITLTATDPGGAQGQDMFTVTVTNVNDPVDAKDDFFTMLENKTLMGNVFADNGKGPDTDPDGDVITAFLNTSTKNGGLTFNGATGQFTYTPNANFTGTDTFTYTATDGGKTFDSATVTITVQDVNLPPDAKDDSFTTPRNTAVSGNVGVNDTDPDGNPLTFSLTSPPANGTVVLESDGDFVFTPAPGFIGTTTFKYTASDPFGLMDTATVEIKVLAPVGLDATDDFFTAPEDTVIMSPPRPSLLANDIDPEGDKFSLISTSAPSSGTLVTAADGSFTYTPFPNFFGTDSFTYTIQDTTGKTDTATVTLTITPVNDVDAVDDKFSTKEDVALKVNAPGVLANDFDPDVNAEHKFAIVGVTAFDAVSSKGGTVAMDSNGGFTYTPAANFQGTDTFTYTISDNAFVVSGGTVPTATDKATVTITVGDINDPPDAKDDGFPPDPDIVVPEDSPGQFIDVLENDIDIDGDKLFVSSVTPPANGTVTIVPGVNDVGSKGGGVIYTPNPNFFGVDFFTYTANDGRGGADTATVRIVVSDQPDVPSPVDDKFTRAEDETVVLSEATLTANDFNPNVAPAKIASVLNPVGGTVSLNTTTGEVTFDPNQDFNGNATFEYTLVGGAKGDTGLVTITYTPVNDPPVVGTDNFATDINTPITVTTAQLLANDSDVEGGTLTVVGVSNPMGGTVVFNTGTGQITFTPSNNFTGMASFNYTVSDGQGAFSTGLVRIQVAQPNRPPVAVDDFRTVQEIGPDGSNHNRSTRIEFPRTDLIANDTDPDGDPLSFVELVAGSAIGGTVSLVGTNNATVRFDTTVNFVGDASFEYKMTDGRGGFDIGKQTITVTDRNDPPVAVADKANTQEDTTVTINVLANDTDADFGNPTGAKFGEADNDGAGPGVAPEALRVVSVGTASNGQAAIGPGGVVFYTPNSGFVGTDSFTYTISDQGQDNIPGNADDASASATVTVTVTDVPGLDARDDKFTVNEDTIRNPLDVLTNDVDPEGDKFSVTGVTQGSKGVVEIEAGGARVLYTPDPNFFGTDVFTYTATDTTGKSDTATVTVTVTDVGEPPDAKDDTATVLEDSPPTVINVLANDVDPEGGPLKITAVTQGSKGTVAIRTGGADLVYQPNPNFFGTDTFTYTATDPQGKTDTATVTVTVINVNDPPDANIDKFQVNEGTKDNVLPVLANDVDIDGDPLIVSKVTQGTGGTVAIAPDGKSVLYTPNAGFVGPDVFTYTARDPSGAEDSAIVDILVVDVGPDFKGTAGDDVFLVRLDASGKNIEVFNNATGAGTPVFFSAIATETRPLTFDLLEGNDRVIVSTVNGNPIPTAGIDFLGGANTVAGDRLSIMGNGALAGTYAANATTTGSGNVTIGGRQIRLTGVEPMDVNALLSFTIVTPNPNDTLALTNVVAGTDRIAGTSGAVTLSDVSLTNVASTIINAAANDAGAGNDTLTITATGPVPSSLGSLMFLSGTGTNTLTAQGPGQTTSMTATASGTGTLDVTVGAGHQMISPEFRYRSLTLGAGSRYQVSPSVPNVISVLDTLTLAGATNAWTSQLDLRTSDLEVQSTAATKAADFARLYNQLRQGFANGTWTGQGIVSSTAATNPAADTGLNLGDNALLGFATFNGEPVTANSLIFKYTYYGDIDQNGQVDADDLTVFANNFGRTSGAVQTDGDIDFNGTVDADDLTVFANNFLKGTPGNPNPPLSVGGPTELDAEMIAAIAESIAEKDKKR